MAGFTSYPSPPRCRSCRQTWQQRYRGTAPSPPFPSRVLLHMYLPPLPVPAAEGDIRNGQGTVGYTPPEAMYDMVRAKFNQDIFALGHTALVLLVKNQYRRHNMMCCDVSTTVVHLYREKLWDPLGRYCSTRQSLHALTRSMVSNEVILTFASRSLHLDTRRRRPHLQIGRYDSGIGRMLVCVWEGGSIGT